MNYKRIPTPLAVLLSISFICLILPFPLLGSDQFLETCLRTAEARDKKLTVAREQLNLSKIRVARTARNFFPYVSLQRRYSRGKTVVEEYQSEEIGARASLPIYEGGRQRAAYRYDILMENAARYNYTKVREELFAKIKLSYYELLSLKMEYTALKKAFTEIDKLMDKVRIEYAAKAIAELDLVEAQNFRDKVDNLLKASESNLTIATSKLSVLINVNSLEDLPVMIPESLMEDTPEVSFTLKECLGFISTNNLDLKNSQIQVGMSEQKKIINRSKVIPKLYIDGFYGQSGEAYVAEPLQLATVWNIMGRLSWGLWGNSMEVLHTQEKSKPSDVVDNATKIDVTSYEVRLNLLDDMGYFVDTKESSVGLQQADAEYRDLLERSKLELSKVYADYENSLRNLRTLKNEIELKERKLDLFRKRNELYEVPTVQVMEECWKYAETISSYARSLYTNYASVTELERMTLMTLR